MTEPDWLGWARELLAISQTGLAYTRDDFDIARYEALRDLAARIVAARTDDAAAEIAERMARETGHATPKLGVRAAVFDAQGRILMVRETEDDHRWSLPGGWADVGQTAAESAEREVREETGYIVRARKLAALWDRRRQGGPPALHDVTRCFFICSLEGGAPAVSSETSEIAWFAEHDVPRDLSTRRVLPRHIARMFAHWRDPALPADFD